MAWNWTTWREKRARKDKVLASTCLPTIRNSRSWGMRTMPVWLPDSWEEAGRTGVKRAHLKVGIMNTERRVPWKEAKQSAAPIPEMPGIWENRWLNTLRKRNPRAVNSLRGLCSFSTFGVALQSHCQERKRGSRRFSDGENMFLTHQMPELDPKVAESQLWETG